MLMFWETYIRPPGILLWNKTVENHGIPRFANCCNTSIPYFLGKNNGMWHMSLIFPCAFALGILVSELSLAALQKRYNLAVDYYEPCRELLH